MTVYWVRTDNTSAFAAMEAVERALTENDTGTPDTATRTTPAPDPTGGDAYLRENLDRMAATWAVDPHRIVTSSRPGLAVAINGFQRLVRRGTWWYTLPQWQQISEFHGALARVIESLLEHHRRLREHVASGEFTPIGRTQALEEQVQLLRIEQLALQNRIAELEDRLAARTRADAE
jgi:hypothetical protein